MVSDKEYPKVVFKGLPGQCPKCGQLPSVCAKFGCQVHATKQRICGLGYIFSFGKYRLSTIEDVLNKDPKYITWVLEKGIIELNNEAFEVYDRIVNRGGTW